MKKLMMTMMACAAFAAPVMGQALVWELDTEAILPNALVSQTVVRPEANGRAWVILQNELGAKLVRVGQKGEKAVWTLPASEYVYGFRSLGPASCVVQAGGKMTRVSRVTKQEKEGNVTSWVQKDAVLPEDADKIAYEDLPEVGTGRFFWYVVRSDVGADLLASKVVLRRPP